MYSVYEVFPDGKKFFMFSDYDDFTCEVWVRNHSLCTTALRNGWSKLMIEYDDEV